MVTDKKYNVGDRVRHRDIIYQCRQAHKSQADWEPQLTPGLWEPVGTTTPEVPEIDVPRYRKRTLLLPVEMDLESSLASSAEEKKKLEEERRKAVEDDEKEANDLLAKHADLKYAITELVKLSPDHFEVKPSEDDEGADID